MTSLIPAHVSPFDALRRIDERGEFWSARDLMPHLGYERWENFAAAIDRACITLANTGMDPDSEASRRHEAFGRTGQLGVNYRLTRHAANLVAMNGDPRKPEIAAAQEYFSIKTREAETGTAVVPAQLSRAELARHWYEAETALEQTQAALAAAEPKVRAWDAFCDDDGLILPKLAAKAISNVAGIEISPVKIKPLLKSWKWLHQVGKDWYVNEPARRAGWVVQKTKDRPQGSPKSTLPWVEYEQVYLTPAGVEEMIRRLTASEQLALAVSA